MGNRWRVQEFPSGPSPTHACAATVAGARAGIAASQRRLSSLPDWVDGDNIKQASVIGTEENTAQVGRRCRWQLRSW